MSNSNLDNLSQFSRSMSIPQSFNGHVTQIQGFPLTARSSAQNLLQQSPHSTLTKFHSLERIENIEDRYIIGDQIAAGCNSVIYKGFNRGRGVLCAVKVVGKDQTVASSAQLAQLQNQMSILENL